MNTAAHAVSIQPPPLPYLIIDSLFASEEVFTNPYQPQMQEEPHSEDVAIWSWRQKYPQESRDQIQLSHEMYLDGRMNLENYSGEILRFLVGRNKNPTGDVYEYLLTIAEDLEQKTFSKPSVFAKNLCAGFKDHCRYNRLQTPQPYHDVAAPTTKETHSEVTEDIEGAPESTGAGRQGGNGLADLLYRQNMALIFARYSAFIDKGSAKYPQFIEQEFDKAIYAFALRKIRNKTFGLPDNSLEAAEDYAIEVVEKAREHVTRIEGGASGFFAWLTKVCANAATDCFNSITTETNMKVSLDVEMTEGDDAGFIVQNPLIQTNRVYYREGQPVNDTRKLPERPPAWVGTFSDRFIWCEVAAGSQYKELADVVDSTEAAIKMRVKRWKQEIDKRRRRAREQKEREASSLRAELESGLS